VLNVDIEELEKIKTLPEEDYLREMVSEGDSKNYKLSAKKGETVTVKLFDIYTGDADLRVKIGRKANKHTFDCKSTNGRHNGRHKPDSCSVTLKEDATVYVNVYGYVNPYGDEGTDYSIAYYTNGSIIDKVVSHCNSEHEVTDSIICLDAEKNFAYALHHKRDEGEGLNRSIYDLVRINLKKKKSEVIEANLESYEFRSSRKRISLKEFKNTPVYLYKSSRGGRSQTENLYFKYKNKTILSLATADDYAAIYDIHTTNNGKNLVLSYHGIDDTTTETYDISNPSVAKLIDKQVIPG